MRKLKVPSIDHTPEVLLEDYITEAASRPDPIPVESEDGKQLYRALVQHIWKCHQRPVVAADVRDLWARIDSLKRGERVTYGVSGIHFKVADYANSLHSGAIELDGEAGKRLAAWLDDWPNVCVLGHTGRGKSSTINRLFGVKLAEICHDESCTRGVTDYRLVTGTFLNKPTGIILWDVPGFGDDERPFDDYVKLYKRLARQCDVVLFMLDNERAFNLDFKMFKKLKRRVPGLQKKIVVVVNKADLFFPHDWDTQENAPSEAMLRGIRRRLQIVLDKMELKSDSRAVAISALKNWNVYGLVNAMVEAAGESKGARLLRAVKRPKGGIGEKEELEARAESSHK